MSLGTLIVWLLPCDLEATIALTPQIKEISDTDTTFAYVVIFNYSILFKLLAVLTYPCQCPCFIGQKLKS
jgi:hypothetical protein